MNILVRLLLTHLSEQVDNLLDPLQFTYHPGVGVKDAITYLLQLAHSHLDKAGSTVKIEFFDFSSASNATRPQGLCV